MKIFLTGGTGFIGSYVAMALVEQGHNVTIFARNPQKVPALAAIPQIELAQGNLDDLDSFEQWLTGKDACIHVALNYTKRTGWEVLKDDTLPTVYMSDMAAKVGVKQFIYTSSTAANDNVYTPGADIDDDFDGVVYTRTKPHPATFYGATKAASEQFLIAQSYQTGLRMNIVRPGYTFGNPVVDGADTQSDTRFKHIVENALRNEPIQLVKHDGTQFIWAGDLAKIYLSILSSDVNRRTYFGLSKKFVSWEAIVREAIKQSGSKSVLEIEDKGWSENGTHFDVSDIKRDFGLEFDSWDAIQEHVAYYIKTLSQNA